MVNRWQGGRPAGRVSSAKRPGAPGERGEVGRAPVLTFWHPRAPGVKAWFERRHSRMPLNRLSAHWTISQALEGSYSSSVGDLAKPVARFGVNEALRWGDPHRRQEDWDAVYRTVTVCTSRGDLGERAPPVRRETRGWS